MCGIIGFISDQNIQNFDIYKKKFQKYHEKLSHRGPDFQDSINFKIEKSEFYLGFNRLAIIDLNNSANKIFYNNHYAFLFNGEIYNSKILKKKYLKNHKFETETDTEVLFQLLIKFGTKIIKELEGMFAFTFIDKLNDKMILCRDYTGIKPLYYFHNSNGFFFSSEAWFLYSLTNKELDFSACKFYFNHGFSPEDRTLVKNVHKVLPGSILTYNFKNNTKNIDYFFQLSTNKINNKFLKTKELVEDVIKKNLISDTKVGIFLSGGLDSSILAITAKNLGLELEAYTSYFLPENKFAKFNVDYKYADILSKKFNFKLNKVVIDEKNMSQKDEIINAYKKLDEPITNFNFFNSFLQSKMAKENNCKVILTGDGADEIFGGYERYKKCYIARKLNYLSFLSKKISKINSLKRGDLPNYFYNFLRIENNTNVFNSSFLDCLKKSIPLNFTLPNSEKKEEVINYFDLKYWIQSESNFKLDRASMLNSIEARVPFQDISFLKNIFPISMKEKINFFNEKIILKNLNLVPNFVKKRKKHGWFYPESFFLRNYFYDILKLKFEKNKIENQKIFNSDHLIKLLNNHKRGEYFKNELITIMGFQFWYDEVLNC